MNEDIYTVVETPHEDMRLIFWGDVCMGYYNPLLSEVLES